ncbi:hypothetical protein IID10_04370, partial [candidate division KSB1 bacterium]|nr:hypothetical protein [candidate division KSB1 bacterium]
MEKQGNITDAELLLQAGGQGIGLGIDIIGTTLSEGFQALPDFIENPLRKRVPQLGKAFLDANPHIREGLAALGQGMLAIQDWAEVHPRAAGNLGAFIAIGSLFRGA